MFTFHLLEGTTGDFCVCVFYSLFFFFFSPSFWRLCVSFTSKKPSCKHPLFYQEGSTDVGLSGCSRIPASLPAHTWGQVAAEAVLSPPSDQEGPVLRQLPRVPWDEGCRGQRDADFCSVNISDRCACARGGGGTGAASAKAQSAGLFQAVAGLIDVGSLCWDADFRACS